MIDAIDRQILTILQQDARTSRVAEAAIPTRRASSAFEVRASCWRMVSIWRSISSIILLFLMLTE